MNHPLAIALALALASNTAFAMPVESENRSWTNTSGKSIEAGFLRCEGDSVLLKMKANGAKVKVPRTSLSQNDVLFVDGIAEKAKKVIEKCNSSTYGMRWYTDWSDSSYAGWCARIPELTYDELYLIAATGQQRDLNLFTVSYTPEEFKFDASQAQKASVICKEGYAIEKKTVPEFTFAVAPDGLLAKTKVIERSSSGRSYNVASKGVSQRTAFPSGSCIEFKDIGIRSTLVLKEEHHELKWSRGSR